MIKKQLTLALTLAFGLAGCQKSATEPSTDTQLQSRQQSVSEQAQYNDLTHIAEVIPEPADLAVDVIASGRVSTLKHIDIVNVGKQIPYTYSHGKITNSPGFNWYVSKHFALKSDRPVNQVQLYMELLEMAYPHYIELFGAEPANMSQQRIAAVYGSSKSATKVFVTDDGLRRGISAGGEAMYYNLAGYSYPSAREQHQRYIVVHEQGHAFQMALMDYPGWLPTWFTEGTADALAHHYYDPAKKQLQVMVFDRGSPMDYVRLGLKQYQQLNQPSILDMTDNPNLYRGINFLIVHFMLDDPERSHLFKAYRDEMASIRRSEDNDGKAQSRRVMSEIFGDWDKVERDFAAYVANVEKTFNVAAGPWEQDGNRYWVRVLNNSYEHGSPRMDIDLKPGDKPSYETFRFDQPLPDKATLLKGINRGSDTPSVGIEVEYQRDHLHRGHVGIAMAIAVPKAQQALVEADKKVGAFDQKSYNPDDDEYLNIKLIRCQTLKIEGQRLGLEDRSFALPQGFIAALAAQDKPKLGLQATIESRLLRVTLRTEQQRYEAVYPISRNTRGLLLDRALAILAENAEHRITPYFDDGRDLAPYPADLSQSAAVNPWRNPADKAIGRLTRAIWRLADKAPAPLKTLQQNMIAATTQGPAAQQASLAAFEKQLPQLVSAITGSGQNREKVNQALVALSGLNLRLEWQKTDESGNKPLLAKLYHQGLGEAQAALSLALGDAEQNISRILNAGQVEQVMARTDEDFRASGELVRAKAKVSWFGAELELAAQSASKPYPWSSMAIVEQAKVADGKVQVVSEFRGPHAGPTKGKLVVSAYPSHVFEQPQLEIPVEIKPYEIRQFTSSFTLKPGQSEPPFALDVSFVVEIDGEPVELTERSYL